MSIPGLGQIPEPVTTSSTRHISLPPLSEYRFTTTLPLTIRLLDGTAEITGTELAPRVGYTVSNRRSKVTTWQGCELEVEGGDEGPARGPQGQQQGPQGMVKTFRSPEENGESVWVSLHGRLEEMRRMVGRPGGGKLGPRVLICGAKGTGKTTLAKTLTSYATRSSSSPLTVSLSPNSPLLSLPGSLSAAVFATILDVEAADGWGSTPASGPSAVPVKLPLVYEYGRRSMLDDKDGWMELVSGLAGKVSGRLSEDEGVERGGVVVDTEGVEGGSKEEEEGVELLLHAIDEMSVNIILVLGTPSLATTLQTRLGNQKTSLDEPIQIIPLEASDGARPTDEMIAQHAREAAIKEYFYGSGKMNLSPQIQQVDFDALTIWRYPDYPGEGSTSLIKETPSSMLEHWTLAVMHASPKDSPDTIRTASVMGYVYVSDVDEERKKLKILAPVSGRLSDRPLILGKWPEPFINLLG